MAQNMPAAPEPSEESVQLLKLHLAVIAFTFAAIATVNAQQTVNNASLSGRVTDPSGAVITGAQVTATQSATNISRTTSTNKDGRFRFPYLALGSYDVHIHQTGFADALRSVTLTVGADFDLQIPLALEGTQTSINVSSQPALVEANRSEIADTISPHEIQNLSLLGRNFLDLALLVPGVSPTNTASTQLFAETSAVPGQGISIGSQRNFSNSFVVDGLSANDDAAGLTGTFYGLDVVREFQVVTSGGQAEFGRALGGYINMVTKSGTNALHGSVYGYLRNQRLNADNALSHGKLPITQAQYGASLAGPILRNRTFYFANFERKQLNQAGLITIAPASVAAINSRLQAIGYQGPQIATGLYSNPVHTNNFFAKIDHHVSDRDEFSARYSLYEVNSKNSRGVGGLSAVSAASALHDLDQTIAISNIFTINPRTVNETRAQFTHSNLTALPNDATGPAVSISGVASFGRLSSSPAGRLDNLYEVVDNLSHQAGSHSLRAGADFLFNDLTITFPMSNRGKLLLLFSQQLPQRHVQQLRLHPVLRQSHRSADQPQPRHLRSGRVEDLAHRSPSMPVFATTCNSSNPSRPTPTTSRQDSASPGRPSPAAQRLSAAASASSTTASRSARSRTRFNPAATRTNIDCFNLRHRQRLSHAGRSTRLSPASSPRCPHPSWSTSPPWTAASRTPTPNRPALK